MKRFILLILSVVLLSGVAFASELEYHKVYQLKKGMTADEIMQIKYHNKYSLFAHDYKLSKCLIYYVEKSGFTRIKEAIRERIVLAGKNDVSYKDIVVLTEPTQAKGLAVLTWTYENIERDQDTWLWIPSLKKVRKISASEDDDSFMGSDFTVEEVSTRRFEDETYKLIGEKEFEGYTFEHTGELKYKGTPCFVIEATPKQTPWYYSKRIVWVDKETGGNIFDEYYDANGKLFKTLYREWTWYQPESKRYPKQDALECKDLRSGHRTVILNQEAEYDVNLSEADFTEKTLERSKW
ncbi:MAG: outer membrane lipoprotein-sorting protein [Candidatus Omnitrophica bacterium]|nr:outer membrane lipoprotein-sorting protein [Candidatus Omnitrophota bacterium]